MTHLLPSALSAHGALCPTQIHPGACLHTYTPRGSAAGVRMCVDLVCCTALGIGRLSDGVKGRGCGTAHIVDVGGGARVPPMLGQGKAWLLMCGLTPHNRHGAGCACCCESKRCVTAAAAAVRSNARGCGAVCRLQLLLLLLPHSALATCCVWAAVCGSVGCGGLERLSGSQLAALGGSSRDSGRVRVKVPFFFSGESL